METFESFWKNFWHILAGHLVGLSILDKWYLLMLEITAIRAIIITMIFRSESISARLFAIRHHHGKGVKAASEPPNSNTIGLLTIQGSPQNQFSKMALCQNISQTQYWQKIA